MNTHILPPQSDFLAKTNLELILLPQAPDSLDYRLNVFRLT